MKRRPFGEARKYARSLGLPNEKAWREYCKSGNKPNDIPSKPDYVYRGKGWIDWYDWLGISKRTAMLPRADRNDHENGSTFIRRRTRHLPFSEARKYVRNLGLKDTKEWHYYVECGNKPENIPVHPDRGYRGRGWIDWYDWLGIPKGFKPFTDAKEYVSKLGLPNQKSWREYCTSGKKPKDIPSTPDLVYRGKGWNGYPDFLGIHKTVKEKRTKKKVTFVSYAEAKAHAREKGITTYSEWQKYCRSGDKPDNIPSHPERAYKDKGWTNWANFLGTGNVAFYNREYVSFEEARAYARGKDFRSRAQWEQHCTSGDKPDNIPSRPDIVYKDRGWTNISDFLGTGNIATRQTGWTITKVKELLRALIESQMIHKWNEVDLYSLLHTKGLLSLDDDNRHSQFFKKLLEASHTKKGREEIENYAYSQDDGRIPDLASQEYSEEVRTAASNEEIARLVNADENQSEDPTYYGETRSVKDILSSTKIESINVDEETMRFFVVGRIADLWKRTFREGAEDTTSLQVKNEGLNGNKFHDEIVETYLAEYEAVEELKAKLPEGYAFPKGEPTSMQVFTAYKINTNPYFGNFSGTGAGKTLSAILASRVINSKVCVIICPNDVIDQWKDGISEAFPTSNVITGKEAFYFKQGKHSHNYLILNYDKFSQDDSPNLIINLVKQNRIDFIILDEIHFSKVRYEDREISQRRRNLDGLLTSIRKKNIVKVLGLSATPVVNNLNEAKSLLEIMTGKIYDDVATRATIPNAVMLYQKLSTMSIREMPKYSIKIHLHEGRDVQAPIPAESSLRKLKRNPLSIEQLLTAARIPEILQCIQGQTMIYTEYVTGVIEQLSNAIRNAGHTCALYTGSVRELDRFLKRKVQVLIASRPISVGVDRLQEVCNRLIINTLPWTNAQYQQLIGRLYRIGQTKDVDIYVIKASIGGYPYDEEVKWKRILFKRTLADCAVDGILPKRNLVTPSQAAAAAVEWLARLERNEFSTIMRRDVDVELTPVQIEKRIIKYGDFSQQNQKFNTELSETTNKRFRQNPEEWLEYHRQLAIKRRSWSVDPLTEIIARVKTMSSKLRIGDFGCGSEAKLMEEFGTDRVVSFDHIAVRDSSVKACDMKSVSQYIENGGLEVVVFCLSLMGKNWPEYIAEAKRCLCIRGSMLIAQTTRELATGQRLSDLREVIRQQGFVIDVDEARGDFSFIEATKIMN